MRYCGFGFGVVPCGEQKRTSRGFQRTDFAGFLLEFVVCPRKACSSRGRSGRHSGLPFGDRGTQRSPTLLGSAGGSGVGGTSASAGPISALGLLEPSEAYAGGPPVQSKPKAAASTSSAPRNGGSPPPITPHSPQPNSFAALTRAHYYPLRCSAQTPASPLGTRTPLRTAVARIGVGVDLPQCGFSADSWAVTAS